MSRLPGKQEVAPDRPLWLAGAPGFEPRNGESVAILKPLYGAGFSAPDPACGAAATHDRRVEQAGDADPLTQPVSERPARKFRILKNPRAETRLGFRGLWRESPKIRRQRPEARPLTSGNVASSQSSVTLPEETAVAGWAERIRTAMCRNSAGRCGDQKTLPPAPGNAHQRDSEVHRTGHCANPSI
jgi:hypothetical protein